MAVSWPPGFPPPLRDDYRYEQPDLNLRTPFAQGARVRPLFTDGPDTFSVSVLLNAAQWRRYQGWLRYEAANGSAWFMLPLRAAGVLQQREVRLLAPPQYQPVGIDSVRVTMPVETRTGTTMSAAEYADLIDGIGFDDYTQTLLTPSDTAVLLGIAGDPAPGVPVPYLGLYLPEGGVIALEGADGIVAVLDLPPGTWFTGLVPRRLLATGTDPGVIVYGLSHASVTELPSISGDRVLPVIASDTTDLLMPAVGGLYSITGGRFAYTSTTGDDAVTLAPRSWWRGAVVTRVKTTGTDADFEAVAFVRGLSTPLSSLIFGDGGSTLSFTDDGSTLEFGP